MLVKGAISNAIWKLRCLSSMKEVEQAQAFIIKAGLQSYPPIITKLIAFSALSPFGSLLHAHALFEETTMDDSFVCNTMIRAYTNSVFPIKAIHIYNRMQSIGVESDNFTFNFVLKACARALKFMDEDAKSNGLFVLARKGNEIHSRVKKLGFHRDTYVQNSLLFMYAQCGFVILARRVFDEMTERSVASWNIMISAYDRINDLNSADYLSELMPQRNVISWNTSLSRYIRLNNIEAARKVFEEMPEKDAVSWNSMISGYVQVKEYDKALELFSSMRNAKIQATEVTFISILGACAETGALDMGRKIHEVLKEKQYKIEGYLGNALVDMYAKCGQLKLAWDVFNALEMKPISCWNAMIVGLALHGYSEEALELFGSLEKLRLDDVKPNRVTFIGLLIACSHKGLVKKGREYFSRMVMEYDIRPDLKHYGCMVDLLSRCGLLEEAYEIIKTCPFRSSSVLWRTLLGACRIHGNVELAEEAFKKLAKLEPYRDGDYVLLSNVYAEAQRWDEVDRVRNEMIDFGVSKKPGSSSRFEMQ